jgi:WD40 repeat protein
MMTYELISEDVGGRIEKVVADGDFLYIGKAANPPLAKVSILNGRNQLVFDEHSDAVFDIRLYNEMLFSASDDAFIICWNVLNAAIIATYVGHTDGVRVITIWNDVLYSSSKDQTIIKWDISSAEIIKISPYFTSSGARSFAFSHSSFISGGTDGSLVKWDFNLESPLFSYAGPDKRLRNVVSWKNYVISGGFTSEIKQWDTSRNTPDPFFVYAGNDNSVNCLFVFEDTLFSGGPDTLVLMWNLTSMTKSGVLSGKFLLLKLTIKRAHRRYSSDRG